MRALVPTLALISLCAAGCELGSSPNADVASEDGASRTETPHSQPAAPSESPDEPKAESLAGEEAESDAPADMAEEPAAGSGITALLPKARARADGRLGKEKKLARRMPSMQQAGPVKAGEWDDNANYREYMSYLESQAFPQLERLDVRSRRFLVVRDADGRGVPRCPVTVKDVAQHSAKLITTASGRAILFPHAAGLTGKRLTAVAHCAEGRATKSFEIASADGTVDLKIDGQRSLPATLTVDVGFILDSTGSMSEEIAAIKSTIRKVASGLTEQNVRIRVGLVEFKDKSDAFVTKVYPMTTDIAEFSQTVQSITASGGGDMPEAVNEGLHEGLTKLAWSDDSIARLAFLVGDAPPHLDRPDARYAPEMKRASANGIQLFTIAASGMDRVGQAVWRQLAQYTGGTNLFVMRGGAGPQSTGGGDPIASCGGTQTSYTSGNLDVLILRKIEREIASVHVDPFLIAGLGQDERAKPCDQRIALQWSPRR